MNNAASPIMPSNTLLYADAEIKDINAFLADVHAAADRLDAHIICINADKVAGLLHINTALTHAFRTWFTDRNPIARSFEMEVLLWVSASRQTNEAAKYGVQEGTMPLWIMVVPSKKNTIDEITRLPGITLYPTPPLGADEMGAEKQARLMQKFSLSEAEIATVGINRLPELIAERVALSAVYR